MNVTGIILAGGKSSRMGTNKALLEVGGTRLIDRAITLLEPLCNEILVMSNQDLPDIKYQIIADEHKNIGPIAGIQAGLTHSKSDKNVVLACDMPNIKQSFLQVLLDVSMDTYQAIIPRHKDGSLEPLMGIYHKSLLPGFEQQIREGQYKLISRFSEYKIHYVPIEDDAIFKNLNTPGDLDSLKG
jgi:molybdopterin-guanine dinucleotide biosynthesis protein A